MRDFRVCQDQLVGIIGNVHFLFAYQLPIVPILRSKKHGIFIIARNVAGGRRRCIIGEFRSLADAALTGQVFPEFQWACIGIIRLQLDDLLAVDIRRRVKIQP